VQGAGSFKRRHEDDEGALRLLYPLPGEWSLRVTRRRLDLRLEWIVHRTAIEDTLLRIAQLAPKA
jgi:hypothetical protein